MASLTAHLREPGDHGALPFHPECPVCRRDRASGAPAHDSFVSHRTKALIAAGVVAAWSASPTAALAVEPDQEQTETSGPEHVPADGSSSDPAFDPGGPSDPPVAEVPVPEADVPTTADDEAGPLEQEPITDEVAPIVDPGDGREAPDQPAQQAPPTAESVPAPAATPTSAAAPTSAPEGTLSPPEVVSTAPAANTPGVSPTPEGINYSSQLSRTHEQDGSQDRSAPSRATAPPAVPASPAPQPHRVAPVTHASAPPASAAATAEPGTASNVRHERQARRDHRVHVVRPNESLWSIAKDVLGDAASPARIAREVNRLWELNGNRIGTGDPDLLMAGTKLVLR